MFSKRLTIFELLGFRVQVDASWVLLALLVTWSLAQGYFPSRHAGLAEATYWWMAFAGAICLFLSLIFHELSHSIVARRYGLPITGITLFIFGGVAEMEEEPRSPKAEFLMAIAGPIASVLLAAGFFGLSTAGGALGLPEAVLGVTRYLAFINLLLAIFNMVPAFPLDGGRAFRAALWYWKGDPRWATKISGRMGEAFGTGLIVLGVLNILVGNFVGGMWWFLIGMFVRAAASSSYYQVLTRRVFEGEPVRRFMTPDPVTVRPGATLEELVEDYIYGYHHQLFPVMEDGRLIGCVGTPQVKAVPRDQWDVRTVGQVLAPCSGENTIDPETDAVKALGLMRRGGQSRLLVARDGQLLGIVTLRDMLDLLSLKMDLEGLE